MNLKPSRIRPEADVAQRKKNELEKTNAPAIVISEASLEIYVYEKPWLSI